MDNIAQILQTPAPQNIDASRARFFQRDDWWERARWKVECCNAVKFALLEFCGSSVRGVRGLAHIGTACGTATHTCSNICEEAEMNLKEDLAKRVGGCARVARANYYFAYGLLIIAVVASATASIAAASGQWLSNELTAVLAALPGVIVLATSTFKFDSRAEWWWSKHHRLDALYRGLAYEGRTDTEVSRELSDVVKELETKWPAFGKPPSGP